MIKIIGIDPAPSKKSTVFDGEKFEDLDYLSLKAYISTLAEKHEDLLICWDAPLSFSDQEQGDSIFTKRIIEKFFSQAIGCKTPEGISVLGYASCPHWMISQYLLGHPNVTSNSNPPFKLIFDKKDIKKLTLTEVHPAVAIWLWTKDKIKGKNWKYKKEERILKEILDTLKNKNIITEKIAKEIKDDDHLDAYIAWKLGDAWINNQSVEILGNSNTGSFLLPDNKMVFRNFKTYCEKQNK